MCLMQGKPWKRAQLHPHIPKRKPLVVPKNLQQLPVSNDGLCSSAKEKAFKGFTLFSWAQFQPSLLHAAAHSGGAEITAHHLLDLLKSLLKIAPTKTVRTPGWFSLLELWVEQSNHVYRRGRNPRIKQCVVKYKSKRKIMLQHNI